MTLPLAKRSILFAIPRLFSLLKLLISIKELILIPQLIPILESILTPFSEQIGIPRSNPIPEPFVIPETIPISRSLPEPRPEAIHSLAGPSQNRLERKLFFPIKRFKRSSIS